jgi:hypothetical protein
MSSLGFLTRTISRVRRFTDEPSTNAKYSDSDIIDIKQSSWGDVLEELNRVNAAPIVVRHNMTFSDDNVNVYVLPPNIGTILRLAKMSSVTGLPEWVVTPRSRWNPSGPGLLIEGNTLRLEPFWVGSSDTLQMDYVPNGDLELHEGSIASSAFTNDSTTQTCSIVLSDSPTQGSLDTRPNAYAGSIFRIISATSNNYQQERIIKSYDTITRTAVVQPAFEATLLPGGTVTYEIAPLMNRSMDIVVALDVSAIILGLEGDNNRASSVQLQYARKMRTLRLNRSNIEAIVGQRFQHDTVANSDVFAW